MIERFCRSLLRICVLMALAARGGSSLAAESEGVDGNRPPPVDVPIERIEKVAKNLYLVPGQGGNSLVWVYSGGVLLVDTKLPHSGTRLLELIAQVTDKPLTHIVLTHAHGDHVGSSDEFPPNVEIISQESTRTNMLNTERYRTGKNMERYRAGENGAGLPDHTFRDRLTLFRGHDTVELFYFGPSHTDGDAVVVFPAAHVMHVGDIMKKKELPTFDPAAGGSGAQFPVTLRRIKRTIKNVGMVIGGHSNEVFSWQDFVRYSELSDLFLAYEKTSLRAGMTPTQTLANFKPATKYQEFTLLGSALGGVLAVSRTFDELRRTRALGPAH